MKKLIIFDLKGTLADQQFVIARDYDKIFSYLKANSIKTALYSMNESWTYKVANRLASDFEVFEKVLLVSSKRVEDIKALCLGYEMSDVIVVGDGEEINIAKSMGIQTVLLDALATIENVVDAIEGACNDTCI